MANGNTETLVGSLVGAISKGATKWPIVCGVAWAGTGVAKAVLTKHYIDSLDSLGYLFLILGMAGIRHSIVSTAADASIQRAEIANVTATSTIPGVQRELLKRETK